MPHTVKEIAEWIEGRVVGDENALVQGITNIEDPRNGHITFVQNPKYLQRLESTDVACLIVPPSIESSPKPLIQVKDPKLAWAKLLRKFYPADTVSKAISPQAIIAKSAKIGRDVTVEPFAHIQDGAEIGDNAVIGSHTVIGKKTQVGADCVLHSHVTLYDHCVVGARCVLHASAVIGADGFGYVATAEGQEKVPQVGNVIIDEDVEIGALTTIDRATVGSTKIGTGCKIDNLVQIGHNVIIGPHTVISAQTGISGSCKIGAHVTMGGKVGLGDHVEIGDWVMVGAGAGFPSGKKVPSKQIVFGEPARPYQQARKQIAAQLRSAETYAALKQLKGRVEALEKQLAGQKA